MIQRQKQTDRQTTAQATVLAVRMEEGGLWKLERAKRQVPAGLPGATSLPTIPQEGIFGRLAPRAIGGEICVVLNHCLCDNQ